MKRMVLLFSAVILLAGCANPFAQFYQDRTGGIDLTKAPVILPTGEPKLFRGNDPKVDAQNMLEEGYVLLGLSAFNAANVRATGAIDQAKTAKAEAVIVYSKHTGTNTGVMPLTLPTTQTTSTNLSGNVFGSRSVTSFYGNANTTTYGTQTTYIPYSVERYDYFAMYWIRSKPPIFGAHVQDLSPELRKQIGSNKGAVVLAVMKNSPAFRSDVLKGDVLRRIGDQEIYDAKGFSQMVSAYAGKKVAVEILRDGIELQKEVQLDPVR